MKRTIVALAAGALLTAPAAYASTGTWTGKISDSGCGASHAAMKKQHGGTMTDAQCVEACVKNGGKYVFVSGGKVYALANQDEKDIAPNAGKTVKLTGDMQGESITVASIAASGKKKK
jgi:hypothetical protein